MQTIVRDIHKLKKNPGKEEIDIDKSSSDAELTVLELLRKGMKN